jgi:nicotinamidase-related amidase
MKNVRIKASCMAAAAASIVVAIMLAAPAPAADIVAEWATVKAPPAPELKAVTLDGKTTALLILDMMKTNCGPRPRCVDTVPKLRKLRDTARAAGAMVFYTLVGNRPVPADIIDAGLAPREGEWIAQAGSDKFVGSDLDERLKAKGIKTVIVCGILAQGAVMGTGSGSARRGYKVIVPVDCMSSEDPYSEQYTAWHMYKGGPLIVTRQTTLTRTDMISF